MSSLTLFFTFAFKALEDAFLCIDSKLTEEVVIKELAQLAGRPREDDGEKVADEDDGRLELN